MKIKPELRKKDMSRLSRAMIALSLVGGLAACASNSSQENSGVSSTSVSADALERRQLELQRREQELAVREAELRLSRTDIGGQSVVSSNLLPPNAKTGECYARVWVEPKYKTESQQVLVRDASEKISLIPAKYKWGEDRILVKEASTILKSVPAVYATETEKLLIREKSNTWRVDLGKQYAPASDKLLAAATAGNIDLASAEPGMCFHEHFLPAQYKTITEDILAAEASTKIQTSAAKYEWVDERVLVSEASFRIEEVPAVFHSVTTKVVDVPNHTIWKKGTGPIQRINEATGEIMCLVEVPATYKTLTKRELKSASTTRRVELPAQYENVKVRKLLAAASQDVIDIPASYNSVTRTQKMADASFVWHEVSNTSMSKKSRTGAKICLVNEPAQYKTISRQVVKSTATVQEIEVPAVYESIKVKRLVSEAREERTEIPAEYRAVSNKKLVQDGHMQWRSILCETNITRDRVGLIQQALVREGYDPGPIDGFIGSKTIEAVNAFQRAKNLPVDKYLNIDTVKALGLLAP